MAVPIAMLRDDFTNNTQDPVWSASAVVGSATKAETGGQAVLTLPSSTAGSHSAAYATSGAYDLTGDGFVWNIGTMVATGVAATAYFQLMLGTDGANQLYWRQVSNAITARLLIGGSDIQEYTATWSATTYKYLRIRESGGSVFWDSSTNGTTWTNRFNMFNPFAVTNLYVQFAATCGNVASPGSLRLDDVNLVLPAPSSTWRETTADWQIGNRLRSVTLASDGGKQGAIVTADTMNESTRALGGTVRYFGGPLGSSSGGYLQATEYASLAAAQASAFPIPIDGRIDLPAQVDARYMRLYHRSIDASSHTIYEYMPRRLVQADDIEAETITAINIAAGAITADKIFVINLSAISADVGTLTAGTIDGVTIYAGGHNLTLDATGISMLASSAWADNTAYRLIDSVGATIGGFGGEDDPGGTYHQMTMRANSMTGEASRVRVEALSPSNRAATITMSAATGSGSSGMVFNVPASSATGTIVATALTTSFSGDVNVGTASGALNVGTAGGTVAGTISTTGSVGFGITAQSNVRAFVKAQDATASNYALFLQDSAGVTLGYVRNDGVTVLGKSGAAMAFFGAGGTTKPTVTGAKASNAALGSLMTALANLGLVTDSTSA